MSFIFVIGPCYKNLDTLLKTIENNNSMISNIKRMYIPTNDESVYNYFDNLNDAKVICEKFADNQGHQLSCFNSIIYGMKMIIENERDSDDDIVVYSHEDVYVKDLDLFNNSVTKFERGYDIVCRVYECSKIGEKNYYMNDAFLIKKRKVNEIFANTELLTDISQSFCEREFTKIIENSNIFSIPYYEHSTHKDSELGFYHILNYDIGDIPFWDKSNIEEIYKM